ncbi:MAG: ABC transporter ATP-binding protein [Lachnospiraceae bacterium]|nr:ABC transporter ATP-binding protein [Lachnospiraceae bacterium]
MNMLRLNHISKRFGNHEIIKDLNLHVKEHSIYGFLGQNGAGKTTTMKMILGLYPADSGEIFVYDTPVTYGENKTSRYIGYLPDVPEFYGFMTPAEYLTLCADIVCISDTDKAKQIPELLELTGLSGADKRIHGFSRGMKQRLGIAQALLGTPKLLICDEPTSALDPVGRKEILDILHTVKEKTTIIFSTHILSDAERICDEIGVLHDGRLACSGTMDELLGHHPDNGFFIEFGTPSDLEKFCTFYPGGSRTGKMTLQYSGGENKDLLAALSLLTRHSIVPKRIEQCEPSLEALFMEVIDK